MQKIYPDVLNQGGRLVIFTPQLPEHSEKMIQEQGLTFPLVRDPELKLAEKLGLTFDFPEDLAGVYLKFGIDLPKTNGIEAWRLPMPARYLVDNDGLIRDAAINPDYTKRPEPTDMLELLKMLS